MDRGFLPSIELDELQHLGLPYVSSGLAAVPAACEHPIHELVVMLVIHRHCIEPRAATLVQSDCILRKLLFAEAEHFKEPNWWIVVFHDMFLFCIVWFAVSATHHETFAIGDAHVDRPHPAHSPHGSSCRTIPRQW